MFADSTNRAAPILIGAGLGLALVGCRETPDGAAGPPASPAIFEALDPDESGLAFVHENGMTGDKTLLEIMGAGAALFDYDGDGDLDVYLVQGGALGSPAVAVAAMLGGADGERTAGDRLFRNDLERGADGVRRLRFTDVTRESGLVGDAYGMGVATGDFDNDGWVDLYVTNHGPNRLWRNRGDGTFEDVTEASGTGDPRWSTSATFLDYDGDGRLDLFVGNYVDFSLANVQVCYHANSARDWCGPKSYTPQRNRLYRNLGDGVGFEDVTSSAGMTGVVGATLGVTAADFDGDGLVDLYVANDADENELWINRGDGTFVDEARRRGAALNADGQREGSMGVDAADFDGDGDLDLFMTHLKDETNTLYVNEGDGWFRDATLLSGLAASSRRQTAFGTAFVDYDNDGVLDLFVANGGVNLKPELAASGDPYPLRETNQLFRGGGPGHRFEEVSALAGAAFRLAEVSRCAAFGDIDEDGDTDVLVTNSNGPARLLINTVGDASAWIGVRLVDRHGRDALGASVAVERDGRAIWRRVRSDGSYLAANDPRILFGLGADERVEQVRVRWPGGAEEIWTGLTPRSYHTLIEGTAGDAR